MLNTAKLKVHSLVYRKEDTPPQLTCFLTANASLTGHTAARDTFISLFSPDIPTANIMFLWCPFNREGETVGTNGFVADGVTFAIGKKHSHAAKILTRGFLRNILPQSLVHVNSPRKYDFFQGKRYRSAGFQRRRTSPHHFFSLLQTPLFPLTNFQRCNTSRILLVVTLMRDSSKQGCFGAGCSTIPTGLSCVRGQTWQQGHIVKSNREWVLLFFFFFLRNVSCFVNAHVPYMVRKTTKISWPSFIPPIILHSLIISFINFLLKINSPIPFKFCIYATSKHVSEFSSPFIRQLSGAGVRHVVVVLQAVKMSSFSETAAVLIAVSTDHWGNWASNTKKPFCDDLLFCRGQWDQCAFFLKIKRKDSHCPSTEKDLRFIFNFKLFYASWKKLNNSIFI